MFRALTPALVLALTLAGCADSEATIDGGPATEPSATAEETGTPEPGASGSDAELIEQTLITWDLGGGCEHMTDDLLEQQTFLTDREEACAAYDELFVEKTYDAEDIVISDVVVKGDKATADFGSEIAPDFTVTYSLVKVDGVWLVDDFSF